jgi:hypothetical protein
VDSDTASDDRMLMATAAAAAGICTASSSTASSRPATASSRGASRPATASAVGGSNGSSSGSNAASAAGSVAAAAAAGALLGVVVEEEGQAGGSLRGGSAAAVAAWWATRFRRDLEGAVFDFFLARWGALRTDRHCSNACAHGSVLAPQTGDGSCILHKNNSTRLPMCIVVPTQTLMGLGQSPMHAAPVRQSLGRLRAHKPLTCCHVAGVAAGCCQMRTARRWSPPSARQQGAASGPTFLDAAWGCWSLWCQQQVRKSCCCDASSCSKCLIIVCWQRSM